MSVFIYLASLVAELIAILGFFYQLKVTKHMRSKLPPVGGIWQLF
jgi:hypothetical protein